MQVLKILKVSQEKRSQIKTSSGEKKHKTKVWKRERKREWAIEAWMLADPNKKSKRDRDKNILLKEETWTSYQNEHIEDENGKKGRKKELMKGKHILLKGRATKTRSKQ